MKEPNIEQKAKAYDEAIERAKAFNKRWQCIQAIDSELALKELKEIFPEFTENEDERIRKEIIYHIQNCDDTIDEETEKRMIAWLEKQGGNLVENGYTNNKDYIKYADNYSHEIWHKLMDNFKNIKDYHIGCNDVSDIVLNAIIDTCNWLEKQGEQKLNDIYPIFRIGDYIRNKKTGDKVLIEQLDIATKVYCYMYYDNAAVNHSDFPFIKQNEWELIGQKVVEQKLAENNVKISEYLTEEKDMVEYKKGFECGKQRVLKYPEDFGLCNKPADKVKPKFHKGDWITNGDYTWKIVEVKPLYYVLQSQDGNIVDDTIHVDEQFHSFTIENAKDGDILVSQCGRPFIYNGNRDSILIGSYCGISVDGNFRVATEKCHWTENMNIHPATKEQRDALTKAMADAGFTFDFEKKELKKIEDEDLSFSAKGSELQEAIYYIPVGFHAEIDDDKVVIKKGEKPTTLSEDDSYMLQQAIKYVNNSGKLEVSTEAIEGWLKSLEIRMTNKRQKNMETKELKISVPAGYEIDKENSTFECVKFKPIVRRWRYNPKAPLLGYYISHNSQVRITPDDSMHNIAINYKVFATEKQAKSALAMAQISQIMANDERFGGVVTDEEWCNSDYTKFVIRRAGDKWVRDLFTGHYHFLAFHTAEQRDLFLQENEDLIKDYLMLD